MSLFESLGKKGSGNMQRASSQSLWQIGDKIDKRYEVRQILGGEGKSGMGIVYVCYDCQHKIIRALKTFQDKYFVSEEVQRLFEREAIIWTGLGKYPYIVQAYVAETVMYKFKFASFIVLEYIAPNRHGQNTLTHYLGDLSLADILKFSIQFCHGMEYAYSKGIDAHRDIKPDNIMISADKTVKITDFGLVKVSEGIQLKEDIVSIGKNPSLSVFQSKGRHICGTLPYMAPEQFDGYADKRSDIYAFGIVLYQMVSGGKLPFVGRSGQEYEKLHRYGRVPSTSSQVSPVLQNCLEKNPSRRYQDFDTIREKLQRLLLKETGEAIISPQDEEFTAQELYNRGLSFWTFCRYQEALPFFDKAIDKKLNEPELYVIKIQSLLKLGKKYEAVSCYVETMKETHLPLSSKIMINILVVLCIFLWPPSLFGFIFGSIYYVLNKGWTYLIRVTKWLR